MLTIQLVILPFHWQKEESIDNHKSVLCSLSIKDEEIDLSLICYHKLHVAMQAVVYCWVSLNIPGNLFPKF
jgi:hypothetical protein